MNTGQPENVSPEDSAFLAMVRENNERKANPEGESDGRQSKEETPTEVQGQQANGLDQEQEQGQEKEEEGPSLLEDPLGNRDLKPKKPTKDENIKNLRSSLNNERARIQELETELEQARASLESPEIPKEVQEQIQAKDERLAQLEHYEKLFGLYNTEGFKETYYDSVDALAQRAKEIAQDYDVSDTVIDAAMSISNRKELIETLSQYFDVHTAGEIRDIVLESQGIIKEREKAEKNPDEVRSQLLSLVGKNNEARINKARENMQGAVSTGWTRMLESYSNPNSGITPLIERPGDVEHTKNRDAILKSAESDLSAVMGIFAKDGLRTINDQVAAGIAARFQLSAAAGYMHKRLQELEAENAALKESGAKATRRQRPLSNSSQGGMSTGRGNGEDDAPSGKDLAAHVFEKAREKMGQ